MNRRHELQKRLGTIRRLKAETQKEINKIEAENFLDIAKKNIGQWYSGDYSFFKILEVNQHGALGLFSRQHDGLIVFEQEYIHYTDMRDMEPITELPEKLKSRISILQSILN